TQWGGHGPPCASNETWSGGCQSRVAKTGTPAASAASIQRLRTGTTVSPPGTASAPPGQKSRWTSTRRRASPSRRRGGGMGGGGDGRGKLRERRGPVRPSGARGHLGRDEVRGTSYEREPFRPLSLALRPSRVRPLRRRRRRPPQRL